LFRQVHPAMSFHFLLPREHFDYSRNAANAKPSAHASISEYD